MVSNFPILSLALNSMVINLMGTVFRFSVVVECRFAAPFSIWDSRMVYVSQNNLQCIKETGTVGANSCVYFGWLVSCDAAVFD